MLGGEQRTAEIKKKAQDLISKAYEQGYKAGYYEGKLDGIDLASFCFQLALKDKKQDIMSSLNEIYNNLPKEEEKNECYEKA